MSSVDANESKILNEWMTVSECVKSAWTEWSKFDRFIAKIRFKDNLKQREFLDKPISRIVNYIENSFLN